MISSKDSLGFGPDKARMEKHPNAGLDPSWPVPSDEQCFAWWDEFEMMDHIRDHSLLVAKVATFVARAAEDLGQPVNVRAVRATALLHDLAKTYTIHHGGNHSQLGGAWVMELTGNPVVALGVLHHVHWPWDPDVEKFFLPLAVQYADKRVKHDALVSLQMRYVDLFERYGRTAHIRERMQVSFKQAVKIEKLLSRKIEVELDACNFDSGRLV